MAYTLSPNLRLRLDTNLTSNSKYNLLVLDSLAGLGTIDTNGTSIFRSRLDLQFTANDASAGGSGTGGNATFGTSGGPLTSFNVYATTLNLAGSLILPPKPAHTVFAGPASGADATPAFRALVASDVPPLAYVTSVGLNAPAIFTVSGSPVTAAGTLAFSLATEPANTVWAGPASGGSAAPAFRPLVTADVPPLAYVTSMDVSGGATGLSFSGGPVTSSGTLTMAGTLAVLHGGTGATSATGTGTLVLSNSPTLVAPILGVPTLLTLTNATGLPLATGVTGTLPVPNGGTGVSTLALNGVLFGNAGGALGVTAAGSTGQVLTATTGGAPTWGNPLAGGTVTSVSVVSAAGVSGTVATPTTTPAITLTLGAITPTSVAATGVVTGSNLSGTSSGTNTGDQTITLTGPVTGSGTGSFATTISAGAVSLTTQVSGTLPVLSGGTGNTSALAETARLNLFTSALQGLVPASGGGTTNFLRADGTWAVAGSGTVTAVSVVSANGVSGSVAAPTTTPAITLTLGAITPSSVAATGTVTGSNLSGSSSGSNTGDQTITLTGPVTGSGTGTFATTISAGAVDLTTQVSGVLPVLSGGTGVTTSTGTGATVLNTSPTLITPNLDTPTSVILTNATGLPLTTGITGILPMVNGGTGASAFPARTIPFSTGTTFTSDVTHFIWDDTNFRLYVGDNTPVTGKLNVTVLSGSDLGLNVISYGTNNAGQIQNQAGAAFNLALVNANSGAQVGAVLGLQSSRGNLLGRTQRLAGDIVGQVVFQSYNNAGGFGPGYNANFGAIATENQTSTANGGELAFGTTPNGTLAPVLRLVVGQDGKVQVISLTASSPVRTDASKNLISGALTLSSATDVTGILPVANGGTGQSTPSSFDALWTTGTAFVATHNLGTRKVMVQVYDAATFATLDVDSVVRTTTNTVTLTASGAPPGTGWVVLIQAIA